jgi:hypothetical protein
VLRFRLGSAKSWGLRPSRLFLPVSKQTSGVSKAVLHCSVSTHKANSLLLHAYTQSRVVVCRTHAAEAAAEAAAKGKEKNERKKAALRQKRIPLHLGNFHSSLNEFNGKLNYFNATWRAKPASLYLL